MLPQAWRSQYFYKLKFSKRAQYVLVPAGKTPEEIFFGVKTPQATQPAPTTKPAEK